MKRVMTLIAFSACTPAPRPAAVALDPSGLTVLDHAPADALEIKVRVIRWACTVTDPQGIEDRELHVPIGRAVRLVLANPDVFADLDVAIVGAPARVHLARGTGTGEIAFRIDRPGSYAWQCPTEPPPEAPPESATHPIDAMDLEAYRAYQVTHREDTQPTTRENKIRLAKQVYERKGCVACHTVDGSPKVGPSLAGIWGTNVTLADGRMRVVDAGYIKASLRDPMSIHRPEYPQAMPSFDGQLRAAEIDALVVYIESLADVKPPHD